jgi:hypothetical protein
MVFIDVVNTALKMVKIFRGGVKIDLKKLSIFFGCGGKNIYICQEFSTQICIFGSEY